MVVYELPLNEVVFDFYDRLKSVSRGYASFDYQLIGYEEGDLVRMTILVNEEPVDALSVIVHRSRAEQRGRVMCEKLKELIRGICSRSRCRRRSAPRSSPARPSRRSGRTSPPSAMAATSRASASFSTSRRKARKMRQFGRVEIPQEAFISALKMDEN